MRSKSKKVLETEKWVDEYILKHGFPPTYDMIRRHFNLKSDNSSWHRCRMFRDKMKQMSALKKSQVGITRVKLEYLVPNDKFQEFTNALTTINHLLKF